MVKLKPLQEALYDLVRLQSDMEDRHTSEIEQKNADIADLTDMVEELADRLRQLQACGLFSLQEKDSHEILTPAPWSGTVEDVQEKLNSITAPISGNSATN